MLSRVAENVYWIGRYVERSENLARLLDVAFHLELDASVLRGTVDGVPPLESVMSILSCRESFEASLGSRPRDRDAVLRYLTFQNDDGHSIGSMLSRARENARSSREALTADAWNQLNRLHLSLSSRKARVRFATSPIHFFEGIKRGCILFSGLVESTLPRNEAYHFLQLGRHLERVNQTARILQIKLPEIGGSPLEADHSAHLVHWSNLLRSCSAYEAFLQQHQDRIDPESVVQFLLLSTEFPRAIQFCVARCCQALSGITESWDDVYGAGAMRLLGRFESDLKFVDITEILQGGLPRFLESLLGSCNAVGEEIHRAYFYS